MSPTNEVKIYVNNLIKKSQEEIRVENLGAKVD